MNALNGEEVEACGEIESNKEVIRWKSGVVMWKIYCGGESK